MDSRQTQQQSKSKNILDLPKNIQTDWDLVKALHPVYDMNSLMNTFKPSSNSSFTNFGKIGKALSEGKMTLEQCKYVLQGQEVLKVQDEEGNIKDIDYLEFRLIIIKEIIDQMYKGNLSPYFIDEDTGAVNSKAPVLSKCLRVQSTLREERRVNPNDDHRYICRDVTSEYLYDGVNPAFFYVYLDDIRHEYVQSYMEDIGSEYVETCFSDVVLIPTNNPTIYNAVPKGQEQAKLELYGIKPECLQMLPPPTASYSNTQMLDGEQRDVVSQEVANRERGNTQPSLSQVLRSNQTIMASQIIPGAPDLSVSDFVGSQSTADNSTLEEDHLSY